MTFGRPAKYKPEYCEQVIELGKQGKSVAQMCSHFDISRQTIDNWAKDNPDFLEAFTRAKVHMQAVLEEEGRKGMWSKDFNAAVWKTTMQARFRDDYTERKEVVSDNRHILLTDQPEPDEWEATYAKGDGGK